MGKKRKLRRRGIRPRQDRICEVIADGVKQIKTEECRRNDGPVDIPAMLVYRLDKEDHIVMRPIPGHPVDDFPSAWMEVLAEGNPDFVGYVSEGYMGPMRTNWQRGDLAREFQQNPCSGVKEVLLIASIDTRRGCHRNTSISFQYDKDGLPRFEPYSWNGNDKGHVPELLAECARQVQQRKGP